MIEGLFVPSEVCLLAVWIWEAGDVGAEISVRE